MILLMMRKNTIIFLLLGCSVIFISTAHAAPMLKTWENVAEIDDDGSIKWEVVQNYSQALEKTDYFIFANIYDLSVFSKDGKRIDCDLNFKDVGSIIICENLLPYNTTEITYKFTSGNQVNRYNTFRIFRHGMSITDNIEYFSIIVNVR